VLAPFELSLLVLLAAAGVAGVAPPVSAPTVALLPLRLSVM
jgi:hypothetical protein